MSDFSNVYEDDTRAGAYATLEFPGTYYLAFRDIPRLLREHVRGSRALDFGCGAGRSTRFLRGLGFDAFGVDISRQMIARAQAVDPQGDYRLIEERDLDGLPHDSFDVILAAFTFDNIPTSERKTAILRALSRTLRPDGAIMNLVSSPAIYLHEWASFSTKDFPENRQAKDGDTVRIVMLDVEDARPVEDVVCSDAGYREIFRRAGLEPVVMHSPLGRGDEPFSWKSETEIAPWSIYVLKRTDASD